MPRYPAFYAADNPLTALLEVIRKPENLVNSKNEFFCLSVWKIRDQDGVVLAPLLYDGIPEDNIFQEFGKYPKEKEPQELLEILSEDQRDGVEEILKFYSRAFQKDEKYAISSVIAHKHLYQGQLNDIRTEPENQFRADIIIYPSMRHDKKTVNYAIHPNFVDERMSLSRIYKIKVNEIIFDENEPIGIQFSFSEYALNDSSRIVWIPCQGEDSNLQKYIKEDFHRFDELKI